MTNSNVIKFPTNKKTEIVEIQEEEFVHKKSLEFAYEIIDYLHDQMYEETGDCIFDDDDYVPLIICTAEVISALFLHSQGHEHPFQEIAHDLFGEVDIDANTVYNDSTNIDESHNED